MNVILVYSYTSLTSWANSISEEKQYPADFVGILSKVDIYQRPDSGKGVMISNGTPDHSKVTSYNISLFKIMREDVKSKLKQMKMLARTLFSHYSQPTLLDTFNMLNVEC